MQHETAGLNLSFPARSAESSCYRADVYKRTNTMSVTAPGLEERQNHFYAFNLQGRSFRLHIYSLLALRFVPSVVLRRRSFWAQLRCTRLFLFSNHSLRRVRVHMCRPDFELLKSYQLQSKHSSVSGLLLLRNSSRPACKRLDEAGEGSKNRKPGLRR